MLTAAAANLVFKTAVVVTVGARSLTPRMVLSSGLAAAAGAVAFAMA
jgi:hypothetical protein